MIVGHRDPTWFSSWGYIKQFELLTQFRDKVKAGGPWDYKLRSFETSHCPLDCPNTTTICGICFYKDVAGNLNYGYIGTWMNIPLYYLLEKAAEAQPGGVDPPEDIAAIRLGAALATLDGSGGPLTVARLCALINTQQGSLNKEFTNGCSPCKEKYN